MVKRQFPKAENLNRDLIDEKNVFLARSKGSGFWRWKKDQRVQNPLRSNTSVMFKGWGRGEGQNVRN